MSTSSGRGTSRPPRATGMTLLERRLAVGRSQSQFPTHFAPSTADVSPQHSRKRSHSFSSSPSRLNFIELDSDPYDAVRQHQASAARVAKAKLVASLSSSSLRRRVRVVWAYTAQHDAELSVDVHDQLLVVRDEKHDDGWLLCEAESGQQGYVPVVYVESVPDGGGHVDGNSDHSARASVARELLDTEQTYVSSLHTILEAYRNAISPHVSGSQLVSIFPATLTAILSGHEQILRTLDVRVNGGVLQRAPTASPTSPVVDWVTVPPWSTSSTLGDIFSRDDTVAVMQLYSGFCNAFPASLSALSAAQHASPALSQALADVNASTQNPLGLSALLLTPIQRLPRYVLLLSRMLAKTAPDHIDFCLLSHSVQKMRQLSEETNENRDILVQSVRLLALSRLLKRAPPLLFSPSRLLMLESVISLHSVERSDGDSTLSTFSSSFSSTSSGRAFIFSDALLLTRERNSASRSRSLLVRSVSSSSTATDHSSVLSAATLNRDYAMQKTLLFAPLDTLKVHLTAPHVLVQSPSQFVRLSFADANAASLWMAAYTRAHTAHREKIQIEALHQFVQ